MNAITFASKVRIPKHALTIITNENSEKAFEFQQKQITQAEDLSNLTKIGLNKRRRRIGKVGTFYSEFLNGSVKSGGDQLVKDFDALSNIQSANLSIEQPWHVVSPTCMKNNIKIKNKTRLILDL